MSEQGTRSECVSQCATFNVTNACVSCMMCILSAVFLCYTCYACHCLSTFRLGLWSTVLSSASASLVTYAKPKAFPRMKLAYSGVMVFDGTNPFSVKQNVGSGFCWHCSPSELI